MEHNNKLGVVLVNLGTPSAPTKKEVRRFLKSFLWDPRVVEVPRPLWWLILNGVILPFRPNKVVKAYQSIWWENGSPLKVITERQVAALQQIFAQDSDDVSICYAMTYGEPSIENQIEQLRAENCRSILVLPLYPQYSATTTGPIYDQIADIYKSRRNIPDIKLHKSHFERPDYIKALAASVSRYWDENQKSGRLLLSFHGIPQACVDKGDPYYDHCQQTAELLAEELGLVRDEWAVSFQSRLGAAQWLQPYTDKLLESWAKEGVASVDVLCPAFTTDCLETLEEIQIENRDTFLAHGGKSFQYIPCLNDSAEYMQVLAGIIKQYARL